MSAPAVDLFGFEQREFPIATALRLLEASPPAAWPTDRLAQWPSIVAGVRAFARCCGGQAEACGWIDVQLYGLHQRAPWSNLAAMGAAFQIATMGASVTSVSADAIAIVAATGSRLRIYRWPPDAQAVLAGELGRGLL